MIPQNLKFLMYAFPNNFLLKRKSPSIKFKQLFWMKR